VFNSQLENKRIRNYKFAATKTFLEVARPDGVDYTLQVSKSRKKAQAKRFRIELALGCIVQFGLVPNCMTKLLHHR